MVEIEKVPCPENLVNKKCPYAMTPTRIVIHNTANDATAAEEVDFMHSNKKEVSFHFAVDDTEIVQGIDLNRNAWHAGDGNGKGNREGIAIEICYSKSGGERFRKAQQNAAELAATLLMQYGWGIERVTKHRDYAKKDCPHRTLSDYGWQYFLDLVKSYMGEPETSEQTIVETIAQPQPQPQSQTIQVTYQVWDDVKNAWLPNVTNDTDYAGIFGHDVCAVFASLSQGNIFYSVHRQGGNWLPTVCNRRDYAGLFNNPIDGLTMRTDTGKTLHYAVHLRRKNKWLPFVTGCDIGDPNNGYAGIFGCEIDAIRIYLI